MRQQSIKPLLLLALVLLVLTPACQSNSIKRVHSANGREIR
jgi:hypothetical protein